MALGRILDYAYYHNVGIVFFEDLDKIKGGMERMINQAIVMRIGR